MHALFATAALVIASTSVTEEAPSSSGRVIATQGLFPIWENTGVLLGPSHVYLGSGQLAAAIGSRVQLGLNPLRFAFRTPNVGVKVSLIDSERVRVAVAADAMWLMPGSSDAFTTSNFSTRLDTSQTSMFAIPLALSATTRLTSNLFVHVTATQLFSVAQSVQTASGLSTVVEWKPLLHHSVAAHATEVGFWKHEFFQFGASYRYQRSLFEARVGVAYQLRADGPRVVPAVSLGVEL